MVEFHLNPKSWFDGTGYHRWAAMPLAPALLVGLAEAAGWASDRWWEIGYVPLHLGSVLACLFLVSLSLRKPDLASLSLLLCGTMALLLCAIQVGATTALGLILSGMTEEAVYRIAVPVVVAAIAKRFLKTAPGASVLVGLGFTATLFTVLPGHVAQYGDSWVGPLPWLVLAGLWSWMLWKGASPIAVAFHHMGLNSIGFATAFGAAGWWWPVVVVVPLVSFFTIVWVKEQRTAHQQPLAHAHEIPTATLAAEYH